MTEQNDNATAVNEMAEDIREVDGDHTLEATELAEKLVERNWLRFSPKDDASVDYPRLEGDTIVLGPEIFANAEGTVINWKGQNYVPQVAIGTSDVPLRDYNMGDPVTVLKNGDWLPGTVSERERVSHILHVNTERGPVTIASSYFIKRRA